MSALKRPTARRREKPEYAKGGTGQQGVEVDGELGVFIRRYAEQDISGGEEGAGMIDQ
jgi:hypothetical protein